jgi:catechol 2,3-dioxygenase-like lactoylglutathione lyase family enzyme
MSEPVGDLHHVGIVVRDVDQAEAFVTAAFGLPVVNRVDSPALGVRAVFLACGAAMVELVEFSDPQLVRDRLGDRVAAVDHVALRVHFTRPDTSAGIIWQLLELT